MQEKILQLLEDRKYGEIAALVKDMNPADAAAMLQELPESKMPLVFRLLPKELAAETFAYMEGDAQEVLIQGFTDKELDEVIGEMFLDDAVDMIEEMPANVVKKILRHVDADTRKMINQVLNYPKDSAGAMMTMEYVDLKRRMTVEQAFERITVRELLLAPKDAVLRDIMETNVKFVTTHTDQEEAARLLSKYDFLALPVVDAEERLVGIVTVDDAMDVMQEEATEDMERMAAIAPSDKPYMKVSVFENWKKRAPWLLFLMISAAFTGSIITHFETALAANLVLSSFIPMLMSTGGNTGSQASTTIIRSLSLGEVRYRDIPQILLKESSTAVLCGVTLAVANFLKLMLLDQVGVPVALVVCLTILAVSLVANLLGSLLPLFAKRVGLDPTVMASPLISTILDAVSLVIYFNIAVAVLQI